MTGTIVKEIKMKNNAFLLQDNGSGKVLFRNILKEFKYQFLKLFDIFKKERTVPVTVLSKKTIIFEIYLNCHF